MERKRASAPSVVVGVDGSRSALDAALWAVDEAVSRDIALRLVYAVDPETDRDPEQAARDLAAGEIAIRYAVTAVESTEKPVKVEVEILQSRPIRALIDASRWAAMLCVGDMGHHHGSGSRFGSTAAAVATAAHCPVAIVRGFDPQPAQQGWIVAEVDDSPGCDVVLQQALDEALLRAAPLRVVSTWRSPVGDYDTRGVADGGRLAEARLDRHVSQWRRRYPAMDIEAVTVHGSTLDYLAGYADRIQLLVVSHERAHGIGDLFAAPGYASLHEAGCSVLLCQPQIVL
ncbi:universal stress protein [Mycobacterium sp. B14F4]|uniref:universal stress protein n=1 Tax=Mycobacterium sp. B14F4 TaxID=3153565 RepID=UPI00325C5245